MITFLKHAGVGLVTLSLTVPLVAQVATPVTPAPAKALTTCEALARDWRHLEIKMAKSDIEEIADNSAPRATMRAIRDSNSLSLASMTLALMRDHKCSLPKRAPSAVTYMLPALECRTEELKGDLKSAKCDTASWKPLGQ